MAKKKVSLTSIFREIYDADTSLLALPTNDDIYIRYKVKTGKDVDAKAKQVNANLKSILRKQLGVSKGSNGKPAAVKTRVGRPAGTTATVKAAAPAKVAVHAPISKLEQLEENIDECLTFAKNLDRTGLESVINNLRRARNEVVWKLS